MGEEQGAFPGDPIQPKSLQHHWIWRAGTFSSSLGTMERCGVRGVRAGDLGVYTSVTALTEVYAYSVC